MTAQLRRLLYRVLTAVTFPEFIVLASLFLVSILSVGVTGRLHLGQAGRICHALLLIISCFLAYVGVKEPFVAPDSESTLVVARRIVVQTFTVMRDWLPLFFAISMYSFLYGLAAALNVTDRDALLLAVDRAIFGETPALLFEPYTRWWLTEVLSVVYMTMMFFPPVLLLVLYLRQQRRAFKTVTLGLMVACFLGYVGYVIVPAVGPAVYLRGAFDSHLLGGVASDFEQSFIQMGRNPRDCFPSMHTCIPTLMVLFAWKHCPLFAYIGIPLVAGIVLATQYLRYHYFIDVVAGFALALFVHGSTGYLERFWQREQERMQAILDDEARARVGFCSASQFEESSTEESQPQTL